MLTGWVPFYTQQVQDMYKLKLTAKVGVPDYVDPHARQLLVRLLERNPDIRLTDPKKIKSHPWFASINWDSLLKRADCPPYVPALHSLQSVEMFDTDFTEKSVESEIGNTEEPVIDDKTDANFTSFSYCEEESIFSPSPQLSTTPNVIIETKTH